jgi:MarR family 2-MHQ and catechol resistance regulon transcriptional repressor
VLHAAGTLESRVEEQLAEVGLSLPKLAALHQLSQAGDSLPLGQLAERLACVKSNVTQLVDRLEADGLVVRAADPNDRRSRLAVITESGKSAYERGIQVQQRAEREIFGALSKEESSVLHELLDKIAR